MSIQHRARIKTVADYSQYLSDIGGCCPNTPDENGNYIAQQNTYQDCISQNGYFIHGDGPWTCPDLSTKGCCCSCSFVDDFQSFFDKSGCDGECQGDDGDYSYDYCYNGGLKEVSECECRAIGGAWAGAGVSCSIYEDDGQLNAHMLCTGGGENPDARWPGACCSNGCTNVCSSDECAEIAEPGAETMFMDLFICNGDNVCDHESADLYCADELAMRSGERDRRNPHMWIVSDSSSKSLDRKRKQIIKNDSQGYDCACVYKENDSVNCTSESKKNCLDMDGVWAGLNGNGFANTCESEVGTDLISYVTKDYSITSSTASTWELGKSYLGLDAVYAGEIYSKSSTKGKGVSFKGNPKTGPVQDNNIETSTKTISSGLSYAVFVHKKSSSISHKMTTRYLSTISTPRFKAIVPDLQTLGFIFESTGNPEFQKNVKQRNNNNTDWQDFGDVYYLTSDYLKIKGIEQTEYIHIQNMKSGFTSTCSSNSIKFIKGVYLIPIKN